LKPKHEWAVMKQFTKAVASAVAAFNPDRFTVTSTKSKRSGKIFIDWMRNGRGSTCVAPWGLRARPGATVSMPISWSQLPDLSNAVFTMHELAKIPAEWQEIKTHHVPVKLLRDLGVV